MTSNYKRGYVGEARVRDLYKKAGFDDAERNRQDTPNHNLPDVSAGPFSIEVKKGTGKGTFRCRWLELALEEAVRNCQSGCWAKVHHWNGVGSPKMVTMEEADHMELVANAKAHWRGNAV